MIFSIFVCILSLFFAVDYKVLSYLCIHTVFFKLSLLKKINIILNGLLKNQEHVNYYSA